MCPAAIFPVITDEQTSVNKDSSQPDDHLLTPENSIEPLVVSQQPSLTRLSKGYKSQTDRSSSSSPISDVGDEIGVSNYHPASDDLASSQYEFWNDYDQADLDAFDEIDAQYALRSTRANSQSVQSQKSNQTPQSSGLNLASSSQETLPLKPDQGPFPHSSISHSNLDLSLCSSAVTGAKTVLPGLTTEESKGPSEGADNDPHPLGVNQTQSSHQDLSPDTALDIPLEADSQPFHNPSCIQPRRAVSFVFQTGAGNPIEMDENLEEPRVATQVPLKTFRTPFKGLINNTVPKPIRKDHSHMADESIFGFTTGHGKQITPPSEESVKRALELSDNGLFRPSIEISDAHSGTSPNPLNKEPLIPHQLEGHGATLHSTGPQLTPPKSPVLNGNHVSFASAAGFSTGSGAPIFIPPEAVERARESFINKDVAEPIAALNGEYQGGSSPLSDLPSIQSVSDGKAESHANLETNGELGMTGIRERTEDVFNVQDGSSVHTRALNNSKIFQSLEAVDKDFTPTRKGSQHDESASSNFQKKSKEDLHILSPIYDTSPALVKRISNKMSIGLTPQSLTKFSNERLGSRPRPFITPFKRTSEAQLHSPRSAQKRLFSTPANFKLHNALREEKTPFYQPSRPITPYMTSSKGFVPPKPPSVRRSIFDLSARNRLSVPMSSWLAPPRAFSPRQLLSLAIPESIVYMTVKSAAIWNFHAFTEPFGAIHALGELIEAGCEINLSKPNWVANHWWMIIWKLASVIKWRPDFLLRLWTPENVVNQLKYRYEREFICGHRPVIKQILEHDCPTIIPMCLVIVSINRQLLAKGGAELKKSSGSSSEVDTHTFELSDGWYKIKATLDQVLERVVSRKKLKVGYKLALSGVSFENTSSNTMKSSKSDVNKGRLDLDLEEVDDLRLHLEGNSTARATWHEPLGFRTRPWFASLRSLTHDGGRIPLVDVLITEIFPAMFISDDLKMGRWGADQEKKLQLAWEIEREKEAELISRERRQIQERMLSVLDLIFEACSGVGSPLQEFEKLSSELDLEDTFEELMESNNQEASLIKKLPVGFIRQLQDFAREKLENFRSSGPSEVQKILDERIPIRRVRSIRILRIRDYQTFKKVNSNESRSAQLLIHDLSRIQDGFLKEGHRYWIENLQPQKNSNWDSRKFDSKNEISIVTRRNTRWREVSLEI